MGIGSPGERELEYYRSECNTLGSRLLRLQEEQSQAHLEARRSRTVVRLVREAYRLAEPSQTTGDIGGALLQIIVENALCDRASILREEPPGSGRFLVAHAIGGAADAADIAITIPSPPRFFFTTSLDVSDPPVGLLAVLRLPFVLWAYDRSSGYALAIGNRAEGNVSRPFDAGDQELIETALFVYLDVLYRKHAEAQLRQAKQSVEEASFIQARGLAALSYNLQLPVGRMVALSQILSSCAGASAGAELGRISSYVRQLVECSHELKDLANEVLRLSIVTEPTHVLDVQWVDVGDALRRVYRSTYAVSVKGGVELTISLPRRRVSMCVDRDRVHQAIQSIVLASLSRTHSGSAVKLSAERRSDGAIEVLVSSPVLLLTTGLSSLDNPAERPQTADVYGTGRFSTARRIVEEHDGVFLTEALVNGGGQTRIIFPTRIVRDDSGYPEGPPARAFA